MGPEARVQISPGQYKMNNYRRGVRLERELMKRFEGYGYYVMRSAGSHGDFDLITIDPTYGSVTLIQIKNHKPTKKERERMQKAAKKLKFNHQGQEHEYMYLEFWWKEPRQKWVTEVF